MENMELEAHVENYASFQSAEILQINEKIEEATSNKKPKIKKKVSKIKRPIIDLDATSSKLSLFTEDEDEFPTLTSKSDSAELNPFHSLDEDDEDDSADDEEDDEKDEMSDEEEVSEFFPFSSNFEQLDVRHLDIPILKNLAGSKFNIPSSKSIHQDRGRMEFIQEYESNVTFQEECSEKFRVWRIAHDEPEPYYHVSAEELVTSSGVAAATIVLDEKQRRVCKIVKHNLSSMLHVYIAIFLDDVMLEHIMDCINNKETIENIALDIVRSAACFNIFVVVKVESPNPIGNELGANAIIAWWQYLAKYRDRMQVSGSLANAVTRDKVGLFLEDSINIIEKVPSALVTTNKLKYAREFIANYSNIANETIPSEFQLDGTDMENLELVIESIPTTVYASFPDSPSKFSLVYSNIYKSSNNMFSSSQIKVMLKARSMLATVPNETNATTLFQLGREFACTDEDIDATFKSYIKTIIVSIKGSPTLCPGIQQKREHQIVKAIKMTEDMYRSDTFSHLCITGIKTSLLKEEGRIKLCNMVTQPGGFLEQAGVPLPQIYVGQIKKAVPGLNVHQGLNMHRPAEGYSTQSEAILLKLVRQIDSPISIIGCLIKEKSTTGVLYHRVMVNLFTEASAVAFNSGGSQIAAYRNIPVETAYLIAKSIRIHSIMMCPQNTFTILAIPVVSWLLQVSKKFISREEIYLVLIAQNTISNEELNELRNGLQINSSHPDVASLRRPLFSEIWSLQAGPSIKSFGGSLYPKFVYDSSNSVKHIRIYNLDPLISVNLVLTSIIQSTHFPAYEIVMVIKYLVNNAMVYVIVLQNHTTLLELDSSITTKLSVLNEIYNQDKELQLHFETGTILPSSSPIHQILQIREALVINHPNAAVSSFASITRKATKTNTKVTSKVAQPRDIHMFFQKK